MRISDWSSDVCSSDLSAGGLGAGFGAALGVSSSLGLTGDGRDCSPSRCALPMTALRLTPPSASAIWLAVIPFSHIALSVSMRSSVQAMSVLQNPLPGCGRRRQRLRDRSMSSQPPFGEIQSAVANAPGVPVIRNVNRGGLRTLYEIGRAHVGTPVPNAHIVCRL